MTRTKIRNAANSLLFSILALLIAIPAMAKPIDEWPRTVKEKGQSITLYQPEVKESKDKLDFTIAVGVKSKKVKASVYGMVSGSCKANVDEDNGSVTCDDIDIKDIRLPKVDHYKELKKVVNKVLDGESFELSNKQLKASIQLAQIKEGRQKADVSLKTDPPKIYVETEPTALVLIDGEPKLKDIPDTNLSRVMNTAFVIVHDKEEDTYYLRSGEDWMVADDVLGPYKIAKKIPTDIESLEKKYTKDPAKEGEEVSQIIVSTEPAALLQINGEPEFAPIPDTNLMYVENSDNDIFQDVSEQEYYTLLSGRWYKTDDDLNSDAEWEYVDPADLPDDFTKIPDDLEKADVLTSVPGTPESEEAVIRNEVPQIAKVSRSVASTNVTYDGEPEFVDIAGTEMDYATNTQSPVVLLDGRYYTVDRGIWFVSGSPLGPWVVLTVVPPIIYTIPPTNPLFPITFVNIFDWGPDFVIVGYTGGYLGSFFFNDLLLFGTGFYYPPWIGNVYFGYPFTFGFDFYYDWFLGNWFVGAPYLDPWWFGWGLMPAWGPFGWDLGWFGIPGEDMFINVYGFDDLFPPFINIYDGWGDDVIIDSWNLDPGFIAALWNENMRKRMEKYKDDLDKIKEEKEKDKIKDHKDPKAGVSKITRDKPKAKKTTYKKPKTKAKKTYKKPKAKTKKVYKPRPKAKKVYKPRPKAKKIYKPRPKTKRVIRKQPTHQKPVIRIILPTGTKYHPKPQRKPRYHPKPRPRPTHTAPPPRRYPQSPPPRKTYPPQGGHHGGHGDHHY